MMYKITFNLEQSKAEKFNATRKKLGCQRNLPLIIQAMILHQKQKKDQ